MRSQVAFAVVSEPLRSILKAVLPATMMTTFEVTCWGWEFHDKGATHERLGQAFMIVTTGHNRLVCADPGMAHSILARRKDFLHPDISLKTMGLLGPNLVTSKDESWSRQRRIIAPAFNERISAAVWKEGVQQASSLIEHMVSCFSAPKSTATTATSTSETASDALPGLRAIAINVLTRVAYGRHTEFSISSSYRDSNKSLSYVDAIALVTDLLLAAAFVPSSILRLPFMPRLSKRLGQALVQLPSLTTDMLDQERSRLSGDGQNNIMTTLLRLSDQAKVDDRDHGTISTRTEKKQYLTENEIAGNLFILTAAGFDTTSNTMSYALVLLAAYPQWQAWIQAEIDAVLHDHDGHLAEEEYATIFPRLTRCLAIMFETLRLYPAVSMVIRTIDTDQTIFTSESSSFPLQAPCAVHVNTMALHTSHSEWGSDRLVFDPSRWLQSGAGFHVPHRGTYMPWSSGPRTCPGQKMSQVEFVSVIMTIFRSCSVEPVLEDGETMEQGRERLLDLVQDSQPVLTLQINRPKEVRLRWMRR